MPRPSAAGRVRRARLHALRHRGSAGGVVLALADAKDVDPIVRGAIGRVLLPLRLHSAHRSEVIQRKRYRRQSKKVLVYVDV